MGLESWIKAEARALGFELAGIAPPGRWATADALPRWIEAGFFGDMAYMARAPAVRADPQLRFPWARSAVLVALDYRGKEPLPPAAVRPVSRYAVGDDYHEIMAKKLHALRARIEARTGPLEGRSYVDTGPLLERAAAAAAGLGWIGKNTMLLNERRGSWLFLGALLLGIELEPDRPAPGRCGSCARCLEACPTRAFVAPYLLDARRCISYLTIELRGPIPRELRPLIGEMIFGCDLCQEVCPWNERAARREPPSGEPAFRARPGLASAALEDLISLLELSEEGFRARFRGSAIRRAKRRGLARNVCVALGNRGDRRALAALLRALEKDPEPLVRGHAAWAIGALGAPGEARAALERAAEKDPEALVREEANAALSSLSRGAGEGDGDGIS